MLLAMLRKIILLIPLIYILPMVLADKVTAVFLAEPIADEMCIRDRYTTRCPGYRSAGDNQKLPFLLYLSLIHI